MLNKPQHANKIMFVAVGLLIVLFFIAFSQNDSPETTPIVVATATPTNTQTPTPIMNTATNTDTPTHTPTPTYIPTHTPTPTYTPTHTPTPTSTNTPTLTPIISGEVITKPGEWLNVREQPGTCYGVITQLASGTKITLLRRTSAAGGWLEIETPGGQIGYVSVRYVEIGSIDNLEIVDLTPKNCTPAPTPAPTPLLISGNLEPSEVLDYQFRRSEESNTFVLMFRPNVDGVHFDVYREGNPNSIGDGRKVEGGGDSNTGELTWNGGSLADDINFNLQIINRSSMVIHYCLARGDVDRWTCN